MGRKPIYVLILTASLQLACYKEPPAPQSSFKLTIKTREAIPAYSVAGIAPSGLTRPAPLAPGRIVSIYGQNLGPIKPCSGSADPIERETPSPHRPNQTLIETWIFPVILCGVEVQVGGLNAGLLYVSAGQINFKVPQSAQIQGDTSVRVLYKGLAGPSVSVPLASPSSSSTAKQIAAQMWSGLQRVKWQQSYNPASGECNSVPPEQSPTSVLNGHAFYCPQISEEVIAESLYYPVDHADPKLLLLRSDIRPRYPYPEQSAEIEQLLNQQLTKTYGTPSIPEKRFEVGAVWPERGLSWRNGTLTIFLHRNRTHVQPVGLRSGVILIAIEDKILERHIAELRLQEHFSFSSTLSQSALVKELEQQLPGTNLSFSSHPPQSEPDRLKAEQQTRMALLRLLRQSTGEPEQRAADLVAADQLVRRLANLLVIRSVKNGSENLVIAASAENILKQLAPYGVHFGGIGHYSDVLDHDYSLLARAWKEFPATYWGHHSFLMLQKLGCATTRFGCDGPNCFLAVIQKGEKFLNSYPATPFRKEQIYHLAQANETWWSLGQASPEDITAMGARTTKASSEQARQRAIALYEQLLQLAPASPEAEAAQLALPRLKLKLDTGARNFFCWSC